MKIIKLSTVAKIADNVRNLTVQSASSAPLSEALADLASCLETFGDWALCGGIAVGVHARPRGTDDLDILLENDQAIFRIMPLVGGKFKRMSDHIIVHRRNGVAVDLVTPEHVGVDPAVVLAAIRKASTRQVGRKPVPVVTRDGLVALKLHRGTTQDTADIEAVLKAGGGVDLSGYPVVGDNARKYLDIEKRILGSGTK